MNEKINKNAKVEQLTKVVLSHGEEKGLNVKDPYNLYIRTKVMQIQVPSTGSFSDISSVQIDK